MLRTRALLALFCFVACASALTVIEPGHGKPIWPPRCPHQRDCAAVKRADFVKDKRGCPLKGCPCDTDDKCKCGTDCSGVRCTGYGPCKCPCRPCPPPPPPPPPHDPKDCKCGTDCAGVRCPDYGPCKCPCAPCPPPPPPPPPHKPIECECGTDCSAVLCLTGAPCKCPCKPCPPPPKPPKCKCGEDCSKGLCPHGGRWGQKCDCPCKKCPVKPGRCPEVKHVPHARGKGHGKACSDDHDCPNKQKCCPVGYVHRCVKVDRWPVIY